MVIAAFASMADRGFYKPHPEGLDIRLETGAGILPVTLTADHEGRTRIALGLPAPRFGEPVPAGEVAAALDLPAEYLRLGDHGPQRVSCGFDQIIVPVNDRIAMRGVFRDMEPIGELTDRRGVGGITLVCPDTFGKEADFHCRFFHPRVGADEDVASGTSLGAAAAYIVDRGLVPMADRITVVTEQGHSLGRPTRAEIKVQVPRGADQHHSVGGHRGRRHAGFVPLQPARGDGRLLTEKNAAPDEKKMADCCPGSIVPFF